ncbi:MAG: DUF4097 domain-containing protein [bacterium]|nr:DUF4097 domain-containing protein [bacterium]
MTRWVCLAPVVLWAAYAQTEPRIVREGYYWVQTTSGQVVSAGVERLRIVTRGKVSIEGRAEQTISYSLRKRVKARTQREARKLLESFRVRSASENGWAELTVVCPEVRAAPELTVHAPRRLRQVLLVTRGGDVRVRDLDGDFDTESEGGLLDVHNISGSFTARTGGGEILLGWIGGTVHCLSGGGGIRVAKVGGEAWFETAGGEIAVEEAGASVHASTMGGNITVGRAAASVVASTSSGLIRVGEAGGEVVAETANGSIQIGAARGVKVESASGAIRLKGISGVLRASTHSGSIMAELLENAELSSSFLHTAFGDVTVFIPSNLAITVKAYNTPAGVSGRILSDFPEIRVNRVKLPAFEPVVAEGALNGGGPLLKVSAVGGSIYLRRGK